MAMYAKSTQSTVSTAVRAYTLFCEATGQWPDPRTGITERQLAQFAALLGRTLKYKTVRGYISMGVRVFHQQNGLPYCGTDSYAVDSVLRGMRRVLGDEQRQVLPITIEILRDMRACLDWADPNSYVFWAMCTVAFFCLLRKGNLTATSRTGAERDTHILRRADVGCDLAAGVATLTLRHTKTIQFKERVLTLVLPQLPDETLCPVTALARYVYVQGTEAIQSDVLMQELGNNGQWAPYVYSSFLAKLKATLRASGVDPDRYAGHSFRHGGATWALKIGIPPPAIKAMGDWKSDAYLRYIHVDTDIRAQAAAVMANALRG